MKPAICFVCFVCFVVYLCVCVGVCFRGFWGEVFCLLVFCGGFMGGWIRGDCCFWLFVFVVF